ncbi:hypothetical protein K402DRAFT_125173 [Aulographum hederae CBS 113979]|uniref:Zn(2)-C6 fungal-type domain-containing protein n=1 Tax=Aulographum hederae CBS 113979 TaxID=1176131 RepID=A0A6G1HDX1_9PEZI|nr:hypothetical protein K402DRAFT_125173 [Aulographum hederae CBS 113979]
MAPESSSEDGSLFGGQAPDVGRASSSVLNGDLDQHTDSSTEYNGIPHSDSSIFGNGGPVFEHSLPGVDVPPMADCLQSPLSFSSDPLPYLDSNFDYGAIFSQNGNLDTSSSFQSPNNFSSAEHSYTFSALGDLYQSSASVNGPVHHNSSATPGLENGNWNWNHGIPQNDSPYGNFAVGLGHHTSFGRFPDPVGNPVEHAGAHILTPQETEAGLPDATDGAYPTDDWEPQLQDAQGYVPQDVMNQLFEGYDFGGPSGDEGSEDQDQRPSKTSREYHFRKSARTRVQDVTTWIDKDQSGNYDPKAKPNSKKRKRPAAKRASDPENSSQEHPAKKSRTVPLSSLAARQKGASLIVTLNMDTPQLQEVAAKITDNWPEEDWNVFENPPIQKSSQEEGLADDEAGSRTAGKNRLRNRSAANQDSGPTPILDPYREHEDLTGYKAARGCVACRSYNINCPLIDGKNPDGTGATWPCEHCIDDGIYCQLLTPPKVKDECEPCKTAGVPCSYRDGGDHTLDCDQCFDSRKYCVAGPLNEIVSRTGRLTPPPKGKGKKKVPSTKTRSNKTLSENGAKSVTDNAVRKTNVRVDKGKAPVRQPLEFRKANVPTPPRQTPSSPAKNDSPQDFEALKDFVRGPDPEIIDLEANSRPNPFKPTAKEGIKSIYTALCHPVHLTYDFTASTDPFQYCHFCSNPNDANYAVNGLGFVKASVIDHPNGMQYQEVMGGHRNKPGAEETRVCGNCCFQRLAIFSCERHRTEAIGEDPDRFFRLIEGSALPSDHWCSICRSAATHRCCKPQAQNVYGETLEPGSPESMGCGLFLCDMCNTILECECDGQLQCFLENLHPERLEQGLRADTELLRENGLLSKAMLQS